MEANLKKKLPQEGTGYSLVGESLGGPNGSSCPSYSGGGQDRSRVAAPSNTETTKILQALESLLSGMKDTPSSDCTSNENRTVSEEKPNEKLSFTKHDDNLKVYQELDDMLDTLDITRQNIGKLEDKSSTIIHKYMLDSVAIINKVATVMGMQEKCTLKRAAFDVKEAVEELLKLSDPTFRLKEKTTPLEMPKAQSESTIPTKSSVPSASHIESNNNYEFDSVKMISFLKNYFESTINEYLDTCEDKLLHEWDVQSNANVTSSKNASTQSVTAAGDKEQDSCKISPASEQVYDVFYEMGRFKNFAMNRIEKEGVEKTAQLWLLDPAGAAKAEAKIDKPRDGTKLQRQQPFWWTADIAELRRVYMTARRQYSRSRRRRQRDEAAEMEHYAVYRSVKKALNAAIERAKAEGQNVPEAEKQEETADDSESS